MMHARGLFVGSAVVIVVAFGCGNGATGSSSSGGGGQVTGSSNGSGGQSSSSSASASGMGGSSSASGVPCGSPSSCPGMDSICVQRTCDNQVCGLKLLLNNMPVPSQIYGDCKSVNCDSMGMLGIVNDDTDVYDDGNPCTVDACTMGVPSNTPAKAGTMCGDAVTPKVCDAKAACVQCAADLDCAANVNAPKCSQGKCVPATCVDMVKNGTETGVDCGGAACAPCADLAACNKGTDCLSTVCLTVAGKKACQPANCNDGAQNGKETDSDCGGADCVPLGFVCPDGLGCRIGPDCASSVCKAGVCQAATCMDGVQNGTEKGTDCGGTCPTMCPK